MTSATSAGLTIDELAARVGMTVRNIRAYASRGLLPPPRLRGRTGLYDEEHLARLQMVKEMLADGYTLGAVERVLAAAPAGVTAPGLALHRALLTPWLPEEPEVLDRAGLASRSGTELTDALLDRLVELGVVALLPDGRLRIDSPSLLRAGLQVVALGIPPEAVVAAQLKVNEHAQAAARIYVDMFRDTVWRAFADAGQPEEEWPRVQQAVERVQPVASQAVLAAFRLAMAQAVDAALGEELGR
ncbi:MAG: MerR family transcriptional regulator [Actinobacteria bacterium]|nr:MerR family transcriptional regulator [Actinomycetota bacterium]MCA1720485.1 MerR family transcriptional regulator [Actinomycetota bacterium]